MRSEDGSQRGLKQSEEEACFRVLILGSEEKHDEMHIGRHGKYIL